MALENWLNPFLDSPFRGGGVLPLLIADMINLNQVIDLTGLK